MRVEPTSLRASVVHCITMCVSIDSPDDRPHSCVATKRRRMATLKGRRRDERLENLIEAVRAYHTDWNAVQVHQELSQHLTGDSRVTLRTVQRYMVPREHDDSARW